MRTSTYTRAGGNEQLQKELAARKKGERQDDRCRRANPLLSDIYHSAAAPVYALLGRCVCKSRALTKDE